LVIGLESQQASSVAHNAIPEPRYDLEYPLTTFIMTYAVVHGIVAAGLVLSATFAAGMIVTVATFPALTVHFRTKLLPLMARTESLRARTGHVLEFTAAFGVIVLGFWPLIRKLNLGSDT
jgi:ABC-type nickel/cobalt efflux system permease component RcnA